MIRRMPTVITAVLLAAGCSGGASTDNALAPDLGGPRIVAKGKVLDFQSHQPIAGARVCVWPDKVVCQTAAADGSYALELPANAATGIYYSAAGYLDALAEESTTAGPVSFDFQLIKNGAGILLAAAIGQQLQPGTGLLVMVAFDTSGNGVAGVSLATSATGGNGPYYFAGGLPSKTQTSTGADGSGIFLNLPPGDATLSITAPMGKSCSFSAPGGSWPATPSTTTRLKLIADAITSVVLTCS